MAIKAGMAYNGTATRNQPAGAMRAPINPQTTNGITPSVRQGNTGRVPTGITAGKNLPAQASSPAANFLIGNPSAGFKRGATRGAGVRMNKSNKTGLTNRTPEQSALAAAARRRLSGN